MVFGRLKTMIKSANSNYISIMRRLYITFSVLLAAFALAGCYHKHSTVYETDEYGVVTRINPSEKSVYLVFTAHFSTNDNGAFENFDGIVPVLDTLASRGVKGSFFPTGNCFRVERYKEPIQRIIDEGHYLSAHSNHHLLLCSYANRDSSLVTADSIRTDIKGMEAELRQFGLTKEQFNWMIPPYEYYNQFSADVLRELGYNLANPTEGLETSMDWMGPESPDYCSAQNLVENIWKYDNEHTLSGVILLIHAMNYPDRTDADRTYLHLGEIIDGIRAGGYDFKTFADIPKQ